MDRAPITRRYGQGESALLAKLVEQFDKVALDEIRVAAAVLTLTGEFVAVEVSESHR
jgi:hypothetical protein